MRIVYLPVLVSLFLYACKGKTDSPSAPATDSTAIPDALQEKNKSRSYYSKSNRGNGNLVDDLYEELKEQTPTLQELEEDIDRVKRQKADSTEAFIKYNNTNNEYYGAATIHFRAISDSVIRERISALITRSMQACENRSAASKDLLALLNRKDVSVNDLYIAHKLVSTIPMIEKFQRTNLPSTKPMETVNKKYDRVISKL